MRENFINISMRGRIAYAIMCFDSLIKEKYPNYNWATLLNKLWNVTNAEFLDEWASMIIEYIPEYMLEFSTYEESEFEFITKEEYEILKQIYNDVDGMVNDFLKMIRDMEEIYAFSNIPNHGIESIDIFLKIIKSLEEQEISKPDISKIENITFDERNGWDNRFDGKKLSIILKLSV